MTNPSAEAVSFVQRLGLQETGNTITSQDDNRFQVRVLHLVGKLTLTLSRHSSLRWLSKVKIYYPCRGGRGLYPV